MKTKVTLNKDEATQLLNQFSVARFGREPVSVDINTFYDVTTKQTQITELSFHFEVSKEDEVKKINKAVADMPRNLCLDKVL